jgi:hypothetical protein
MPDPWARPGDDRPADRPRLVEVELTPHHAPTEPAPIGPGARPRSRARGALAAVAVIAGAATVAIVAGGGSDDDASPAATTLDASAITTPATLGPLETVAAAPVPTTAAGRDRVPSPEVPEATFPGEAPFDVATITVPSFPSADVDVALDTFDLLAAAAANQPGTASIRTVTTVDSVQLDGLFTGNATVTAAHDPVNGHDELIVDRGLAGVVHVIADRADGTLYRAVDEYAGGGWLVVAADRFIEGTGASSLDELFDAFASGPVTPEVLAAGTIEPFGAPVTLPDGTVARPYTIEVRTTALRPYGLLLVANVAEETVADGSVTDTVVLQAYVTDDARLALVTAVIDADGGRFLIQQRFEPADDVSVEIPTADQIVTNSPQRSP